LAKKRNKFEVIYDILSRIIDKGNSIKVTPLTRYSGLSPQSFNEYYYELLNKELIKEIMDKKGNKLISVTDRGFKYLQEYKIVLRFIDEFEL
jgi:predicted transcriptional regulator